MNITVIIHIVVVQFVSKSAQVSGIVFGCFLEDNLNVKIKPGNSYQQKHQDEPCILFQSDITDACALNEQDLKCTASFGNSRLDSLSGVVANDETTNSVGRVDFSVRE